MEAVSYLAEHARCLSDNVDTNLVEQFNAITQNTRGKRTNYTLRGSYQGRRFAVFVAKMPGNPFI